MSHHHGPPHMPQRFLMQPSPGFPPRGPPMMPGGPPPGPLPPHSSPYLPVSMAQAMAAAYNPVVTGSGGYPPPPHQQGPYPFPPRQPSLGMPMPPATGPQPPHAFYPGPHNPFMSPHMAAVAAAAAAGQPTAELPHPAALFQGLVPPPHALHNSQSTSHTPPQPSSTPPVAQSSAKPLEVPYFNLPAGLIVPLVKPEDCDYKPLDPKLVKLPPPVPPSDRLIKAVELFYAPPSHERPRNADGWEKLALYEFYKSKTASTKGRAGCHANEKGSLVQGMSNKENDSDENKEDKSNLKKIYDENNSTSSKESSHHRRYKEDKSPSRSKEHRKRHSRSHSHGRSRSRTPERRRRRSRHRKSSSSSSRSYSSSSSSRSRSRSPSPKHSRKHKHHHRHRSPSKSSSPESYRPSLGLGGSNVRDKNTKLEESNKGHQLLKKMGWSGTGGLGNKEQGISEPIPTGEVRDASNAYKGIGADSSTQDMYELYRKSRGKEFLDRIQKSKSSH